MEKALRAKHETTKCSNCNQQFIAIMEYMPSNGDVCRRCIASTRDFKEERFEVKQDAIR
jgi:formylmethanofuran dehydrogenase subunit E